MKHNTGISCIELGAGANTQVVPKEADKGPPEGFVDNTVRVYRMIDGEKVLIRIEDPFQPGWDQPQTKLSGFGRKERGEDIMPEKKKAPSKVALSMAMDKHKTIDGVAKSFGVGWGTARKWLKEAGVEMQIFKEALKQTPDPEPEKVGRQDPVQEAQEPAGNSVQETVPPVKMPLGMELPPERVSYTSTQYQEQIAIAQGNYSPDDNDFTLEDEEPIPYIVAPAFDLAPVKIQLICTALAEYKDQLLPADIALELVRAIGDIQFPGVR